MRKNLIIRLLSLIKGFRKIVILAVINGIVGNLLAMSVAIFASLTLAKALGLAITLSYPLLLSLMVLIISIFNYLSAEKREPLPMICTPCTPTVSCRSVFPMQEKSPRPRAGKEPERFLFRLFLV